MSRVVSYNSTKYIGNQYFSVPASGASPGQLESPNANTQIAVVRFKKHSSQAGGTTPIAYFNVLATTADSEDMPIYDGDLWEFYEEEIPDIAINSSDANTPTAHVLYYRQTT